MRVAAVGLWAAACLGVAGATDGCTAGAVGACCSCTASEVDGVVTGCPATSTFGVCVRLDSIWVTFTNVVSCSPVLSIKPDIPINVYTWFCLNTAKSKFSLVSPVAD